jgi:hypothetical protein
MLSPRNFFAQCGEKRIAARRKRKGVVHDIRRGKRQPKRCVVNL